MLVRAVRPWADAFKTKAEKDGGRASLSLGSAQVCTALTICTGSCILEQFAVLLVLRGYVWMNDNYEGSVNI